MNTLSLESTFNSLRIKCANKSSFNRPTPCITYISLIKRNVSSFTAQCRSEMRLQNGQASPTWRLERQALASSSEEIKRFSALTPLGQKRAFWIGTGNLSLLKRNALTTKPRLHINVETLRFMKQNCKKEIAIQKTCWERFCSLPTLVQTSAMQVWRRILMESVCKVVIYHPAKKLQAHVLWRCSSSSWGSVSACSP